VAGEAAVKYARSTDSATLEEDDIEMLKSRLYGPLGKTGIPPKKVLTEIQEIAFPADVCILKNGKSLQMAIDRLQNLKENSLPLMAARDAHYLLKLKEVEAIAFVTDLYLRASLMRTETRAGHYRTDHPRRDEDWLKWIVIQQKQGEISLRTEPVPLERYPFKPTRYYMDNFNFPLTD
jgi:succinate dehydrogenase/fumarate reductase flavoprotein subunit